MMKRQAYEVIAEIEKKWNRVRGCMIWSWSTDHLVWLIERWKFKNPADTLRRTELLKKLSDNLAGRQKRGLSPSWVYFYSEDVREMMIGAGLSGAEAVRKPVEMHDRVISIPERSKT